MGRQAGNAAPLAVPTAVRGEVAFIATDDVTVKMYGLGLATAVAADATLVRMVLVPATMSLLGANNWWLPRWLDRILPHMDLEGGDFAHGPEPASAPVTVLVSTGESNESRELELV